MVKTSKSKKHLNNKLRDWILNIDDENIKKIIKDNVIVTGGAIVSLLTGEKLHDYDVYFRTKEACLAVATYYVGKWNEMHPDKPVSVRCDDKTGKIDCFVSSKGCIGFRVSSTFGQSDRYMSGTPETMGGLFRFVKRCQHNF